MSEALNEIRQLDDGMVALWSNMRADRSKRVDRDERGFRIGDLRDDATVEACRRVIDTSLNDAVVAPEDLHIVVCGGPAGGWPFYLHAVGKSVTRKIQA